MSSDRRIASSRANGAKSRGPVTPEGKAASAANSALSTGPVTPEGKAISSQNAIRHGLLSQSVVLHTESAVAFEEILNGLRDELQPATPIERRLVEIMALADWRRIRVWCVEMATLTHAINAQERAADPVAEQENALVPAMHTALAIGHLSNSSNTLQNLNRYEVRYAREYHRALRAFNEHRAERLKSERDKKYVFSERTEPNA